jgi:excisionase family DNA binding protein
MGSRNLLRTCIGTMNQFKVATEGRHDGIEFRRRPCLSQQSKKEHNGFHEAAEMLGVNYSSVYRLVQRGKLKACRVLRGKLLISRRELLRLIDEQ